MAHIKKDVYILEKNWPLLFNFDKPKPLIIDIDKLIYSLTDESDHAAINNALEAYTRRLRYTRCLANGRYRYNLEGQALEEIGEEQVLVAKKKVAAFLVKAENRIKQKAMEKLSREKKALIAETPKKPAPPVIIIKKKTAMVTSTKATSPSIVIKKKRTIVIPPK